MPTKSVERGGLLSSVSAAETTTATLRRAPASSRATSGLPQRLIALPASAAPDEGEHRRCPELAAQKPLHAADTDPAERRQGQRDREPQLHARLLRDPRRQRVDELPVEEDDLEEHHEELDHDHLDDVLPLPL